jgi:L-lactate dehydrogenase complex protein LldG
MADTELVGLFAERAGEYRAGVHRCDAAALPGVLAGLLSGASGVVIPQGTPEAWTVDLPALVPDDRLTARDLDAPGLAVLTGCALAVAETGTLALDGGAGQGRRLLTLVPDHHVCVVHTGQIVADVPDLVAALPGRTRPITMISGPSATSDIELNRVEGVHGPRRLDIVIVHSEEVP